MTIYHMLYILTAISAVFIQAKSRTLQDLPEDLMNETLSAELSRLLLIRRFMSPFIAGFTALLIFIVTVQNGQRGSFLPLIFIPVWLLASLGDIFIEGAYSIEDKKKQDNYYLIGMVIFMGMTVLLGGGLIKNALQYPLTQFAHILSISLAILSGIAAFLTLKLDKSTLGPMIVYDLSVSVLFCGGLYSLFAGQYQLAYIGIAYFVSDWLVGIRDFGKKKIPFLERWILLIILLLYYSIMLLSLDAVLKLG